MTSAKIEPVTFSIETSSSVSVPSEAVPAASETVTPVAERK
ncbi:MAG TPA: hypothetical protein VF605_19720 [Allosphingosinicella sp.]